MRSEYAVWIGLLIIAALLTLAAKYYAYFPGDVAVERWVQSLLPQDLNWAAGVSRTAEFPWVKRASFSYPRLFCPLKFNVTL